MGEKVTVWNKNVGCCIVPKVDSTGIRTASVGSSRINISSSVGLKGRNLPNDVLSIQKALNRVPTRHGGPAPKLKEDSICGSLTRKAIHNFQLNNFGWKYADGLIELGKMTIAKLREFENNYTLPFLRVARAGYLSMQAEQFVMSARRNVAAASYVINQEKLDSDALDNPTNYVDSVTFNVKRHFEIDKFPRQERRPVLSRITLLFDMMLTALRQPNDANGIGLLEFNQSPYMDAAGAAYAKWGGFYEKGQTILTVDNHTIKADKIYVCSGADTINDEWLIYLLIHELAHFVGREGEIDDFTYALPDDNRQKGLSPYQKVHNATNYSNFAFETHIGRVPIGFP